MIPSRQISKSTLWSILIVVGLSFSAIQGSTGVSLFVSAAKGQNSNISFRPKRGGSFKGKRKLAQVQSREIQEEKETRCKFLKSKKGKGTKAPTPPNGIRRRRTTSRTSGVHNPVYKEQIADPVYIDGAVDPKVIVPPPGGQTPPPPPGKGKGVPPPPGFEWDYGPDGKDSDYDYIECEYPSAAPSESPRPSTKPSVSPSRTPTNFPSKSPTSTPTLSMQPSVSMAPTVSNKPSSSPSMKYSDGCEFLKTGGLTMARNDTIEFEPNFATNRGIFEYQLVSANTLDEAGMEDILRKIDEVLLKILTDKLIWCGTSTSSTRRRQLMVAEDPNAVIDGISMNGNDDLVVTKKCLDTITYPAGYKCEVYLGTYTVWARADTDPTHDQLNNKILGIVMNEMKGVVFNNVRQDHLADKLEDDLVYDIVYGGGTLQSETNNNLGSAVNAENSNNQVKSGVSAFGGIMIAGLATVLVFFLFAAVRKREHTKLQRVEELMDDDQSLFGKSARGTDPDGHVLGEDDSIYSEFDSDDIVADMQRAERSKLYGMGSSRQLGPQEGNLGGTGHALNVHTCTSATCPICQNQQSPTFVDTNTGDVLSPIEEVSGSREEETPKNATTPTYSDTVDMDMAQRNYQSPDTVEF